MRVDTTSLSESEILAKKLSAVGTCRNYYHMGK